MRHLGSNTKELKVLLCSVEGAVFALNFHEVQTALWANYSKITHACHDAQGFEFCGLPGITQLTIWRMPKLPAGLDMLTQPVDDRDMNRELGNHDRFFRGFGVGGSFGRMMIGASAAIRAKRRSKARRTMTPPFLVI